MKSDVESFCEEIGADSLLVQGAGGNISWKEGTDIWVKASGTRLADANRRNIFVKLSLASLDTSQVDDVLDFCDAASKREVLKPSLETALHILIKHPVVLHLHVVDVLAFLVRSLSMDELKELVTPNLSYDLIQYCKPGADLARTIGEVVSEGTVDDVIFMKSHGIVLMGNTIAEVKAKLMLIVECFSRKPPTSSLLKINAEMIEGYQLVSNSCIQQLALNPRLYEYVVNNWALYPDHVVFLGGEAKAFTSITEFRSCYKNVGDLPDLVFIQNLGVYSQKQLSVAKTEQLRCFYDVLIRQPDDAELVNLSKQDVSELLNWDAERYRISQEI